ncbi:ribosomal RNA small subunit methyltransferase A [Bombiscardovia nodaiensis]|uniref:Ribosomal RNA small subunit methyltransferase A n=1 Tax=Bombiscardovia nodaiensis TaxID=2932181 RepID=A0ABM8BAC7_9BIFI|nr:ribosomal RNA small subunit methyltransferase A [Bombiscardovia nodaiensis]
MTVNTPMDQAGYVGLPADASGIESAQASSTSDQAGHLLGAADIRRLADQAGVSPTKKLGQNFVIDPGTVRHIVRLAALLPQAQVLEVGPGLGSLTLGLLEAGAQVTAVEIDPRLAALLPSTVAAYMPQSVQRFSIVQQDALTVSPQTNPQLAQAPSLTLVSNLPYNVATPILLNLLERFNNLQSALVMVQKEVADRLVAEPGSKIYGIPSAKLAWYGSAKRVGRVGRNVFWPAPNVDSALVSFQRAPQDAAGNLHGSAAARDRTFQLIDAAFAQRRKTLRSALSDLVEPPAFAAAGIDPQRRGETLSIAEFARLAAL